MRGSRRRRAASGCARRGRLSGSATVPPTARGSGAGSGGVAARTTRPGVSGSAPRRASRARSARWTGLPPKRGCRAGRRWPSRWCPPAPTGRSDRGDGRAGGARRPGRDRCATRPRRRPGVRPATRARWGQLRRGQTALCERGRGGRTVSRPRTWTTPLAGCSLAVLVALGVVLGCAPTAWTAATPTPTLRLVAEAAPHDPHAIELLATVEEPHEPAASGPATLAGIQVSFSVTSASSPARPCSPSAPPRRTPQGWPPSPTDRPGPHARASSRRPATRRGPPSHLRRRALSPRAPPTPSLARFRRCGRTAASAGR